MSRVAILSSADGGGAGHAAARLAAALAESGIATDLLGVAAPGRLPDDVAPAGSFARRPGLTHVSVERPGFSRPAVVERLARYDVVNVHWASGLVAVGEIFALARRGRRVVLTLHDFCHVTGGCHYPAGCGEWQAGCVVCPQLDVLRIEPDVPRRMLSARRDVLALPNVFLTAPSAWLRDTVVAGGAVSAARAHVLRNPYRAPAPIPEGGREPRILLVADSLAERRKNVALALDALALWRAGGGVGTVDLVGGADEAARERLAAANVPFAAHGRVADPAALTAVFSRAAVVLTASTEDNWPNILVEAGAYGARAVVGPGHGCAEFVAAFGHGEVAARYDAASFAAALAAALAATGPGDAAAAAAIRAAHAPETVAAAFAEMFLR